MEPKVSECHTAYEWSKDILQRDTIGAHETSLFGSEQAHYL